MINFRIPSVYTANSHLKISEAVIILLLLLITIDLSGQKKCSNPPVVRLSSVTGSVCYRTPVTIADNSFGGSATMVTLTENGHGTLTPSSANTSPFSFTYVPSRDDIGHTVTITVTTNNPLGGLCKADRATYSLNVMAIPGPPLIDEVIQPTCTRSTGSIKLNGLPSGSGWILTVNPGGMMIEGNDTSFVVDHLAAGTYTFTISTSSDCISSASAPVEISGQPPTPETPVPGNITAPTCAEPTGSVVVSNLPETGAWILTRYPGTVIVSGTGKSTLVDSIPPGNYNFIVTNYAGCNSMVSSSINIPVPPQRPTAPVPGQVIQPAGDSATGSVELSELPASGGWILTRYPDKITYTGAGTAYKVTGLAAGTYTFTVTDSAGCTSDESSGVEIHSPVPPVVVVTDPAPACYPSTVDLTDPSVTAGSDTGLTFTYWADKMATEPLDDPTKVSAGTFYIKGTSSSHLSDIEPVNVISIMPAVADAGPDQTLGYQDSTTLAASLADGEHGTWIVATGGGLVADTGDPQSAVSGLSAGKNTLCWIVDNNICPADTDKIIITTGELVISTLITPNGDGRNECFTIRGIETLDENELNIFDRKGTLLYSKTGYDNSWKGVDRNDRPLINDTYYFVLRSPGRRSVTGYVVIRR